MGERPIYKLLLHPLVWLSIFPLKAHNDIGSGLMYVDPLLPFSSGQSDHLIFFHRKVSK